MNISELFIRRPVMTTLLMLSVLAFGIMAYTRLPVSDLPNVDFPTIQVSASLPGANPGTMASAVATPLEKEFSTIAGLDTMTSASSQGSAQITLQFNLDRNIDAAAQDVQVAISRVLRQLPKDMPTPPTFRKVNPADQPILRIALTSPTLPLYTLNEYGETLMAQRISMVSGVAQVQVYGAQKYAVRIQLDPKELAARGIGINQVAEAVAKANVNLPTGTLYGAQQAFTVQASGQLTQAEPYRSVIVTYINGQPVRLGDIGSVYDSVENNKVAAWYVNQRSVILAVQRQPGTNTVEVAGAVKRLLPVIQAQLPASVSLHILYDASVSIEHSVNDVKFTLLFTLALVILVIFLFLRRLSFTLIPSLAMPMSLIGTFIVMYLMGYNIDNLSLMALILAVGFVVDDAIIMLENIVRHLEMGEGSIKAALNGSREIGFTIVSMTLSLVAVFIPILFMGGIIGRLFSEFAVTIGMAILISGLVSLTLTPMLCSRFLKPVDHHQPRGRLYAATERGYEAMLNVYKHSLRWFLNHRGLTMLFLVVIVGLTVVLFRMVPKGFIPSEDRSIVYGPTEAAEGISFEAMKRLQQALADIVREDPNVEAFMSNAGSRPGGIAGGNTGTLFMVLKPRSERTLSADEVIQQLRPKLAQVPGIRVFLQNPPAISVGGRISKSQYQYTLQGSDVEELYRIAPQLAAKIQTLPGFLDITTDLQLRNPQVNIEINRDKASSLGISAEQIEDALYSAYGSRQISTIYADTNQYQVIMELKPEYQLDPAALPLLYVRSTSGALVPLDVVVRISTGYGPLSINHSGQLPSVTISFNLRTGVALGDAVSALSGLARTMLPATITASFQGTAQVFESSLKNLGVLLLVAVMVIYIVLGILYESFIHPITILSALPLAGVGALLTLLIFNAQLDIYSFVGLILLVGLVKKNGIIMIDFALEAQRVEHKTPMEAIYEACIVRFRPIMMTTFAALVGTLPIAVGWGAGGESRQPLGLAVVGGLLFSQMLTLFVTPVFYLYMDTLQKKLRSKFSGVKVEPVRQAPDPQ
ncbi:MAG TPA: efflux RND transporter permease subunit [Desulfobacterales bacterium]|nr:efflux RND transporter permease subunit [Desulfobacterales bacterium]